MANPKKSEIKVLLNPEIKKIISTSIDSCIVE